MTITSNDLMVLLRASMNAPSRPSPGYIVGELEAPTGGRRADALFFPLGHTRRGEIHGYEFKISRSDLLTELADPMKADPWLRYCTTWNLLVSDPKIVQGLDIPEAWGILAPPATNRRALTVIRPAPKLRPTTAMSPALMQAIARLYYGGDGLTDERVADLRDTLDSALQREQAAREQARLAEQRLAAADPSAHNPNRDLIDDVVRKLAHRWSKDYSGYVLKNFPAERLAELLCDIDELESLRSTLAAAADRDLKDLEQVHATRGMRLKQARQQIDGMTK